MLNSLFSQIVWLQSQHSRTTKWAKKRFAQEEINLSITAARSVRAPCHLLPGVSVARKEAQCHRPVVKHTDAELID